MNRKLAPSLLVLLLILSGACSGLQMGFERTPTVEPAAEATLSALEAEREQLEAEVTALEATLGITPQPTIDPAILYQPIPLGSAANAPLDLVSPPTGRVTLGGIPFELAKQVFKSQSESPPGDTYPTMVRIPADVPRASRLHLLLTAGNGFTQFEGEPIGRVVVTCDRETVLVTDLVLGRDVREWHPADNVVDTTSRARQVWIDAVVDHPELTGHIDLVSYDLPEPCQGGTLTAIEVVDTTADTIGSLDPALNLVGVTVEHEQP